MSTIRGPEYWQRLDGRCSEWRAKACSIAATGAVYSGARDAEVIDYVASHRYPCIGAGLLDEVLANPCRKTVFWDVLVDLPHRRLFQALARGVRRSERRRMVELGVIGDYTQALGHPRRSSANVQSVLRLGEELKLWRQIGPRIIELESGFNGDKGSRIVPVPLRLLSASKRSHEWRYRALQLCILGEFVRQWENLHLEGGIRIDPDDWRQLLDRAQVSLKVSDEAFAWVTGVVLRRQKRHFYTLGEVFQEELYVLQDGARISAMAQSRALRRWSPGNRSGQKDNHTPVSNGQGQSLTQAHDASNKGISHVRIMF